MKKGAKLVLIASLIGAMATPVSANVYLGAGDLGNTYQNYRISNGISRYKYADIDGNGIVDMMFRKQAKKGLADFVVDLALAKNPASLQTMVGHGFILKKYDCLIRI